MADVRDLRFEIEDLYAAYVECLDDGELEQWPELFTEECLYKIIPRDNFERGLPLALMLCESKGMLQDRVAAVRQTSVYAPRSLRHLVSSIRIKPLNPANRGTPEPWCVGVHANYLVLETPHGEETRVFNAGKYLDRVVRDGATLKFKEKLCVFDSVLVPGSLIYPI
jgi:3-phenylpropionate/cinnamic acid dioxygenase small subunit